MYKESPGSWDLLGCEVPPKLGHRLGTGEAEKPSIPAQVTPKGHDDRVEAMGTRPVGCGGLSPKSAQTDLPLSLATSPWEPAGCRIAGVQ